MTASKIPVITLDGPGGAGKGTVSVCLAKALNWAFLDSGALYRLTALSAINHGIDPTKESAVSLVAEHLDVKFEQHSEGTRIVLEGDDVTDAIRQEKVGKCASVVAAHNRVRVALLKRQRAFVVEPGLIADGRDMGTVVFTDAPLKIYLTATAEERAKRRLKQLEQSGIAAEYAVVLADIQERDDRDQNRAVAPLKPAEDAIVIDTTGITVDQVVQKILNLAKERKLT